MSGVDAAGVRAAAKYPECHEEVSRGGEAQPCDKWAVAVRIDPNGGGPYPVCAYHSRADMVPLSRLVAALAAAAPATPTEGES